MRRFPGLVVFLAIRLAAQSPAPDRVGDSTVVARTVAATRLIYDSAGGRVFSFIAGNALDIAGANATEIQATYLNGAVARVVAGTWGAAGKYGVEFYYQGDSLLFSFDTFEYIAEAAPPRQWQNFKRLPAWERRVYWNGPAAAFVETSGSPARLAPGERERLLRSAGTLRELMKARRTPQ
jgi:hypothetical protein